MELQTDDKTIDKHIKIDNATHRALKLKSAITGKSIKAIVKSIVAEAMGQETDSFLKTAS